MKKAKYYLALLAVVAIITAGIGQAMAYFTTYAEAEGGITIWLGDNTTITETFSSWNKAVTIENEEGEPVFVRAKVFYAPNSLSVTGSSEGGWSTNPPANTVLGTDYEAEGNSSVYYYYSTPLKAKEKASVLNFKIDNIPQDVVDGDSFNVVVVYESTPAIYHSTTEEGEDLYYADWTTELVVTKRTGDTTASVTQEPDDTQKPEVQEPGKEETPKTPGEGTETGGDGENEEGGGEQ